MRPATPTELREITVRDYLRDAERRGAPMTHAEAQRRALVDCQIHDAVIREERPRAPAPPDPAKAEAKAGELDRQAAALGAEVDHGQLKTRRAPLAALHKRHRVDSRAAFAKGRIRRILEGASMSSDLRVACSTATCPDLALEVLRLYANLFTRGVPRRPGDEQNPFFGMSDRDASRMAQAILENICDRSSGRLGPWWVPK